MTAVERAVRSYLKQEMRSGMNLHRTWPDYAYRNRHDLLMQHGRTFAPQPRPKGYRQRAMGLCFRNSVSLAISRRLRYAEGVAMHPKMPMLVHHAWCLDAHDRVVDVTSLTTGKTIGRRAASRGATKVGFGRRRNRPDGSG